jgi:hypothetical protein
MTLLVEQVIHLTRFQKVPENCTYCYGKITVPRSFVGIGTAKRFDNLIARRGHAGLFQYHPASMSQATAFSGSHPHGWITLVNRFACQERTDSFPQYLDTFVDLAALAQQLL